ncbi:hypothetical protein [Azospirillum sp. B2RO_4]|uniref:hypothetical protein n=1 Tax=Azospirillum sp. B2RO_4 TaxID=3027796 RepID=UPI003DA96758
MASKDKPRLSVPPSKRIALFRSRAAIVESLFAAGRLTPMERREALATATAEAGIPSLSFQVINPGKSTGLQMTEEQRKERRREKDRRRYWRNKKAAMNGEGVVHG